MRERERERGVCLYMHTYIHVRVLQAWVPSSSTARPCLSHGRQKRSLAPAALSLVLLKTRVSDSANKDDEEKVRKDRAGTEKERRKRTKQANRSGDEKTSTRPRQEAVVAKGEERSRGRETEETTKRSNDRNAKEHTEKAGRITRRGIKTPQKSTESYKRQPVDDVVMQRTSATPCKARRFSEQAQTVQLSRHNLSESTVLESRS